MKTIEQIKQWMSFRGILERWSRYSHQNIDDERLQGVRLYNLISSFFTWRMTDEGDEYWRRIDREYRDWYDSASMTQIAGSGYVIHSKIHSYDDLLEAIELGFPLAVMSKDSDGFSVIPAKIIGNWTLASLKDKNFWRIMPK